MRTSHSITFSGQSVLVINNRKLGYLKNALTDRLIEFEDVGYRDVVYEDEVYMGIVKAWEIVIERELTKEEQESIIDEVQKHVEQTASVH
jgi:2-methylisocitrate lyase-like PEP mutase family enzyme